MSVKGQVLEQPKDAIKDPYILEFIGLPENTSYSESELEQKLIDKLEHFLMELGTGFTFVARQKRISFDDKHFRIDLGACPKFCVLVLKKQIKICRFRFILFFQESKYTIDYKFVPN